MLGLKHSQMLNLVSETKYTTENKWNINNIKIYLLVRSYKHMNYYFGDDGQQSAQILQYLVQKTTILLPKNWRLLFFFNWTFLINGVHR